MSTWVRRLASSACVDGARGAWLAPLSGLLAFVAYWATAPRGVLRGDAGEMQFIAWRFGIPHGTGYPLYILIAKLFTWLPLGEPAFRVTLASCFFGGATVDQLTRLCADIGEARSGAERSICAAFALGFGLSPVFWDAATTAEMYTLQAFLTLVVLRVARAWDTTQRRRWLALGSVLLGAMSGNHASGVALLFACVVFVVMRDPRRIGVGEWLACAVCPGLAAVALFNLLPFWALWLRQLPEDHWHTIILANREKFGIGPEQARSFWYAWWFTIRCRQDPTATLATMSADQAAWQWSQVAFLPLRSMAQAGPLPLGLAAAGCATVWRRNWRVGVLLATLFGLQSYLVTTPAATMKAQVYFLVPAAVVVAWGAVGAITGGRAVLALEWGPLATALPRVSRAALFAAALVAVHAATTLGFDEWLLRRGAGPSQLYVHGIPHESSSEESAWARRVIDATPRGAVVFALWTDMYALHYVARRVGRTDLEIFEAAPMNPSRAVTLSQHHLALLRNAGQRPVVFTFDPVVLLPPDSHVDADERTSTWRARG